MGQPEWLGPMTLDRRPPDEERGVRARAADRRGLDGMPARRNREQSVRAQERPARPRGLREPFLQRGVDQRERGGPPRDCDNRQPELSVERVEVEDIKAADDRSIEQDRADAVEGPETPDEGDDSPCPVRPVDPHVGRADGLDVIRQRQGDRREGRRAFASVERSVVHPDHARVDLSEGTPQG